MRTEDKSTSRAKSRRVRLDRLSLREKEDLKEIRSLVKGVRTEKGRCPYWED